MNQSPAEFEVRQLDPAGLHYILPPRDAGRLRPFGWIFIALGVGVGGFGLVQIGLTLVNLVRRNANWFEFLFSFRNAFAIIGFFLFAAGYFLLFGRSEVKLQNGQLKGIERAGLLRWTFKQSASNVAVLDLFDRFFTINGVPVFTDPLSNLCVLRAGNINLAPGYPYETCLALAEHLQENWVAALCGDEAIRVPSIVDGTKYAGTEDDIWLDESIAQPSTSKIQMTSSAEHLTLRIPRPGLGKDTRVLFFLALGWNGSAIALATLVFLAGLARGPGAMGIGFMLGVHCCVGIALVLAAIETMRREYAIALAGDQLLIVKKSIFGSKRHWWRRDEVRAVLAASAGTNPDHTPRIELQIRTVAGKTIGFLSGRDTEELQWLAAVIRRRLFFADSSPARGGGKQHPHMAL